MNLVWALLQPILAVALGLSVGLGLTWFTGESPFHVAYVLWQAAFGSDYAFGMTLFYMTPLVFTGLSVSIAFRAGLFNIGAEGQLLFGAMGAAVFGALLPNVPWPWAPFLGVIACAVGGGAWGAIPGWLRSRRGSHEVITTIMLNFVAAGLTSYVVLYLLPNPQTQNPETQVIGQGYWIHHFETFGDAPLSTAWLLAVACAFGLWIALRSTVWGYEIDAVGENESAAREAGIDVARVRIRAMAIAGALAGLVGVSEVLGSTHRFKMGFSPDYGFIGIAVALLARNHPIGILGAALLFGALHKGAGDLDMETEKVTRDLSLILEALVILSVSADAFWRYWRGKLGGAR